MPNHTWNVEQFEADCRTRGVYYDEEFLRAFIDKLNQFALIEELLRNHWTNYLNTHGRSGEDGKTRILGLTHISRLIGTATVYFEAGIHTAYSLLDVTAQLLNSVLIQPPIDIDKATFANVRGKLISPSPHLVSWLQKDDSVNLGKRLERIENLEATGYLNTAVTTIKHRTVLKRKWAIRGPSSKQPYNGLVVGPIDTYGEKSVDEVLRYCHVIQTELISLLSHLHGIVNKA